MKTLFGVDMMSERVAHLECTELPDCGRRTLPGVISQRACMLYGARWMLADIGRAVHLIHGPVGCAYYSQTVRKKHCPALSTGLEEKEIIFGAGERLEAAITEACRLYPQASAVLVYSTCTVGLIGEDVAAICRRATAALGVPVVPVNCPGFGGISQGSGHDVAAQALLEHLVGKGPMGTPLKNSVNILGEFDVRGDLEEIERLLQRLGLSIICAVSGRATVDNLAMAYRARLNLVHCGRTGRWLACKMEERFGIPWIKVSFYGVDETLRALQAIATFFGLREEAAWVEEEAEAARQRALPYTRRLRGKRVALFFGASRIGSMARVFKELGMEVAFCGSQFGCQEDYAESRSCLGQGIPMIDDAHERELEEFWHQFRPDLVVGGTREKYLAHKIGLPFLVLPQEVSPYAGFAGFVNLAREAASLVGARVWSMCHEGPASTVQLRSGHRGGQGG